MHNIQLHIYLYLNITYTQEDTSLLRGIEDNDFIWKRRTHVLMKPKITKITHTHNFVTGNCSRRKIERRQDDEDFFVIFIIVLIIIIVSICGKYRTYIAYYFIQIVSCFDM